MGRDRTLSSELPQRVAMDVEVLGCTASIQPRAVVVGAIGDVMRHQAINDQVGETAQELIDQSAVWLIGCGRCGDRRPVEGAELVAQGQPLRSGVGLHRRDLLQRFRPGPGVLHHRRGCFIDYVGKISGVSDGKVPFVRFRR